MTRQHCLASLSSGAITEVQRLLFVCVENANRSQMAEAFARIHGGDRVEAYSAGSRPSGKINPNAIAAMKEIGYDLSQHHSKSLSEIPDIEFDFVATMGCGDECPFVRAKRREDWDIPDPKHLPPEEFHVVRDLIEARVKAVIRTFEDPRRVSGTAMDQALQSFIDSINAHDVEGLGELMADDHTFIDAHGNEVRGREKMLAGWRGYFEWFPDYRIEVEEVFDGEVSEAGQTFALFGFAGGSFKGSRQASWRLPAAWKAIVKNDQVALWQVFCDTKIPFEIIERNSQTSP